MKVLLVDDHSLFREGMALLLAPLTPDLCTVSAGSCEEAFEVLEREPDVSLVLMDLGLPGLSGLGGIAAIRERFAAIPVVALSSADDKATVLAALDAGAMGFIPKSSSASVMIGALRLILAKGIYLPPSTFLAADALGPRRLMPGAAAGAPGTPATAADGSVLAAPRAPSPADLGLSSRQAQVLYRILQGKQAKVISRELELSAGTTKAHTSAVLRALNVTTRTQAVVAAGRLGLRFEDGP